MWDQSWGPRRRVDWVGVLAGEYGDEEGRRSPEVLQFAFNLPGPPYVLLCTRIAREGIDLHLWCRRVVQYDLEWNPALMEQQVGRVDRIGSLSRRDSKPVEVVWAWVPGTYEEYMARKVRERMEMMKVLLAQASGSRPLLKNNRRSLTSMPTDWTSRLESQSQE